MRDGRRVGAVLGLGGGSEEALELVLGHGVGSWTFHVGGTATLPGGFGFGGATWSLSDQWMVHLEYVAGSESEGAAGWEYSAPCGFGFIVSGISDFEGGGWPYLNFIWTGRF